MAIEHPAPYEPWPSAMRHTIGENYRELVFAFFLLLEMELWFMCLSGVTSSRRADVYMGRVALRWRRGVPTESRAAVRSCQTPEDVPMLERVCQRHDGPMAVALARGRHPGFGQEADDVDAGSDSRARRSRSPRRRRIGCAKDYCASRLCWGSWDDRRRDVRVFVMSAKALTSREIGEGYCDDPEFATLIGLLIANSLANFLRAIYNEKMRSDLQLK